MNTPIKVGLIGFGYWGPNMARNFSASHLFDLLWIADLSEDMRRKAGKMYPQARTTADYKVILDDPGIELIVIATPLQTHYALAEESLRKGKHVLVEKPMTQTSHEAQALVDLADSVGRVLAVDHPFLYSAPVRKLKELIDSGELGDIFCIDSERLNLGLIRTDASVFLDLAVHDIYIADYLFGNVMPLSVIADGEKYTQDIQHELGFISLRYAPKRLVNITVSWLSPVKLRKMLVVGSKKMAYYDDTHPDEKIRVIDKGVEYDRKSDRPFFPMYRLGDTLIPRLDNKETLAVEVEELYHTIRSNAFIPSLGSDGVRVMKILELAQKSLESRQEVSVV